MQYIKSYIKFGNWYNKTQKEVKRKYKKDNILFSGLLASTSPRFHIKRNINASENIYNDYIINKKAFIIYALKNKKAFIKKYKLIPAHYNNIIRVLKHDIRKEKRHLILSGLKVNSFYNNLIGKDNYITIDIWILKYFNHTKNTLNKSDYIYYSKAIIKYRKYVNKKYNKRFSNSSIQAILWTKQRLKEGFKPKAFYNFI